jgi:SPP1 gp7 family putative phage head morphogenesis protein
LPQALKSQKADVDIDTLFDIEEEVDLLFDLAKPLLGDLFEKEGSEALKRLGIEQAFDVYSERVREALENSIELLAESYNKTTRDKLEAAISVGLEEGESVSQIADRLRDVYKFDFEFRAEQVARTEVFRAANAANREAMQQSGIVKKLKWFTALDERTCPYCAKMNGKTIAIDEQWFEKGDTLKVDGQELHLDYANVEAPPLHPNCRCDILAEEISVE